MNGIVASNYITLQDGTSNLNFGSVDSGISWHWVDHVAMAPYRMWLLARKAFGMSLQDDSSEPSVVIGMMSDTVGWIPGSSNYLVKYFLWPIVAVAIISMAGAVHALETVILNFTFSLLLIASFVAAVMLHRVTQSGDAKSSGPQKPWKLSFRIQ